MSGPAPALSGRRLHSLARRFGTPFYVYDFDAIEARARRLRAALAPRFDLFYAVKANPSLAILRLFASLGLGADVASRGELALALRAGFPAKRILMTGPAKSDADLRLAVERGILGINVEGEHELERLEGIVRRRRLRMPVQLRLNPDSGIRESRAIIGGDGATKFGIDLGTADRILRHRGTWPSLEFCGIQVFQASNVLDAQRLLQGVERVLDLALGLAKRHRLPLRTVDFGGGLGVPYVSGDRPLDLSRFSRGLRALARRTEGTPELAGSTLLFEPGRWLVAEAGVYVARVLEVKKTRGRRFVLVDGGIHHMARPALLDSAHPVRTVSRNGASGPSRTFSVGGPLCTSIDLLASRVRAPLPDPGDLIVVGNAGAYGFTESMPLFLSHEWPEEVGLRGPRAYRLRSAPTVRQLQESQSAPPALVAPSGRTRISVQIGSRR